MTEEILNALAQIPGLRVAGRSSAFSFKGGHEDLRAVGAKLGVATILEGTLRRAGNRLRLTAQLIDAGSGYQLWSERYDRVMEDVFDVQDEIARTIAQRLTLSLGPKRGGHAMQPPTRDLGAYELYLKGRALLYQRGLSILKAIDCFTEAVALDPTYAQAWAGLADGYTTSGYSGFKTALDVMPRALQAARRALELDPALSEAHSALACATMLFERDYVFAERAFQRALELNPRYPQALAWYGLFCQHWIGGRTREGHAAITRLVELDRLSGYAHFLLSFSDFTSDHVSEAVGHAQRGIELDPNSYLGHWALMQSLHWSGRHEEAAVVAERALAMSGRHPWALECLVSIYAACGKPDEARAVYREMEVRSAREVRPADDARGRGQHGRRHGQCDCDRAAGAGRAGPAVRDARAHVARFRSTPQRRAIHRDRGTVAAPGMETVARRRFFLDDRRATVDPRPMQRLLVIVSFVSAAAGAALLPSPARAQQAAPLGGVWSLNRSLSEFPAESGSTPRG